MGFHDVHILSIAGFQRKATWVKMVAMKPEWVKVAWNQVHRAVELGLSMRDQTLQ